MAANYTSAALNFSSCHKISAWGESNPCVPYPSSFNPYHVNNLSDFTMHMLQEIISNDYFGTNLALCYYVARILPPTFRAIDAVTKDPSKLDVAVLTLQNLTMRTVPAPYNESSPNAVSDWWWDNIVNDYNGTRNFLSATKTECTTAICHSLTAVGDPDITGIGMIVSTGMLIVLAMMFAFPALFSWTPLGSYREGVSNLSKRWVLRDSLVASLDDLFSAVILFTVSVLISSIIYRLWNDAFYSIFMAEVLSLISSTAMVMIGASYWNHFRLRPTTLIGFVVNSVLTIVLFGIEFWFQHSDTDPEGLPLEHVCLKSTIGGTDLNNLGDKRTRFPVCFAFWCVALLASMLHILWVNRGPPPTKSTSAGRTSLLRYVFLALGWVPIVFGTAAMIWLCVIFYSTWKDMRRAFGHVFVDSSRVWSFGQFLALVTWLPPILQFAHLMFSGMSKGLTSKLPKPLVALFPDEGGEGAEKPSSARAEA